MFQFVSILKSKWHGAKPSSDSEFLLLVTIKKNQDSQRIKNQVNNFFLEMSIFFQEATMDNESCDKSATDIECRKKSATDPESTDAADTESSKSLGRNK